MVSSELVVDFVPPDGARSSEFFSGILSAWSGNLLEEISVILTPLPKAREAHSEFRIPNSYPRLGFETYRENSDPN